jgi:hypothetical protein
VIQLKYIKFGNIFIDSLIEILLTSVYCSIGLCYLRSYYLVVRTKNKEIDILEEESPSRNNEDR